MASAYGRSRRHEDGARESQLIFQDPYASLDPRMSVGDRLLSRYHSPHRSRVITDRVAILFRRVGLRPIIPGAIHTSFSAVSVSASASRRALVAGPRLIVADESVSALDVSVRAHVLDLMLELQEDMGLAYLFISHDMAVIERMSHYVAVMRGGEIVEQGARRAVRRQRTNIPRLSWCAVPRREPRTWLRLLNGR